MGWYPPQTQKMKRSPSKSHGEGAVFFHRVTLAGQGPGRSPAHLPAGVPHPTGTASQPELGMNPGTARGTPQPGLETSSCGFKSPFKMGHLGLKGIRGDPQGGVGRCPSLCTARSPREPAFTRARTPRIYPGRSATHSSPSSRSCTAPSATPPASPIPCH